ncbi:MAG: autotransporter outer membrane beta-barrel domain-containing protein [Alphaproteobacteria bacterium]|nr:autotransporter outer membrane beta-barrel domain-containing protein [Alphaproteobacteria bacterium]
MAPAVGGIELSHPCGSRSVRSGRRARPARSAQQRPIPLPRLARADRKSLLLGTALASTLLLGTFSLPSPAVAIDCTQPAPPAPITEFNVNDGITCNNTADRNNGAVSDVILLTTDGVNYSIDLYNSGDLTANANAAAYGINTAVSGGDSPITIENLGDISATSTGNNAFGVSARVYDALIEPIVSPVIVTNNGDITASATTGSSFGIFVDIGAASRNAPLSSITIVNGGTITSSAGDDSFGIFARSFGLDSDISINNSAAITTDATEAALGIYASTTGTNAAISILNSGALAVSSTNFDAYGILAKTHDGTSPLSIVNSGDGEIIADRVGYGIKALSGAAGPGAASPLEIVNGGNFVITGEGALGIDALTSTLGGQSPLSIVNSGNFELTATVAGGIGIQGQTSFGFGPLSIVNSGDFAIIAAGNGFGILGQTFNGNSSIEIINGGDFAIEAEAVAYGIQTTSSANSPVAIDNDGDFAVTSSQDIAFGIRAQAFYGNSTLSIVNSGAFTVTAATFGYGIQAGTYNGASPLQIDNSGDLAVIAMVRANGISALTFEGGSTVSIENSGDLVVISAGGNAAGIRGETADDISPLSIVNSGGITANAGMNAYGIAAITRVLGNSPVEIVNGGDIAATSTGGYAFGISALTDGVNNSIDIYNSGDLASNASGPFGNAYGVRAVSFGAASPISVRNSGDLTAIATGYYGWAFGIQAFTQGDGSPIDIVNSGDLTARADGRAFGIDARSLGAGNAVSVRNSGNIVSEGYIATGIYALSAYGPVTIINSGKLSTSGEEAWGINSIAFGPDAPINVVNSGDIAVTSEAYGAYGIGIVMLAEGGAISIENRSRIDVISNGTGRASGIRAFAAGGNSPVTIVNSGDINVSAAGGAYYSYARAISAFAVGAGSPLSIENSGNVFASGPLSTGVYAFSLLSDIVIVNTGSISAGTLLAIDTYGASTQIFNTGRITGFVDLTDSPDRFFNQAGGVFETKLTSDFGGGGDLFRNEAGGMVLAATDPDLRERSAFINLERFENRGLISMVDGRVGDVFEISNTVGQEDLTFAASGGSTLAVDAFLGGPGSVSDEFIVNGKITGKTVLQVNNTNPGIGSANAIIPVIFANGAVKSDAFFLTEPIDTGLFQYDLFFRPTGSGIFELRSFTGPGALLLPQLITATQDIWHQGSSTWFDRTADLRVLLAGGVTPTAYNPNGGYVDGAAAGSGSFTPAVWARGSGAWLDRDGSETVNAFGRNYTFDLSRDLDVLDWQMGLDLGHRDLLSPGDILVFGVLGGFVGAGLDYDQLARQFDFSGGQVGGYATYLRGGLFVDTLLNAHLLEMDTAALGMPSSLDANTLGLRTDTGYRFGSFNGGAFIEPLATIEVLWSDIDGFINSGNRVSFDDEANVRGRLGLRAGTSYPVWNGTTMEPFVIGSLWGHLSGDNQATLVSSGTTFRFEDNLDDVWGEVSAGVNFFNPSAGTAVFAKLDVTFGDDVDGIGGKAGMRVAW